MEHDPEAVAYLADRALLHNDLRQSLKRRQLQQWVAAVAPSIGLAESLGVPVVKMAFIQALTKNLPRRMALGAAANTGLWDWNACYNPQKGIGDWCR